MKYRNYPLGTRIIFGVLTIIDWILLIPYNVAWCCEYAWMLVCHPFRVFRLKRWQRRIDKEVRQYSAFYHEDK